MQVTHKPIRYKQVKVPTPKGVECDICSCVGCKHVLLLFIYFHIVT